MRGSAGRLHMICLTLSTLDQWGCVRAQKVNLLMRMKPIRIRYETHSYREP